MCSTSASLAPKASRISHTSDAEHAPSSASTTPIPLLRLNGATLDEHQKRLGFEARLLDRGFEPPTSLPHRGLIDFVRLIRSNRELRILGSKIPVPPELVHRYVTATLHVEPNATSSSERAIRGARSFRSP